jgi:sugar phosphate isomerase/epimerase
MHNHYFANRKFLYESPDDVLTALNGHPNLFSTFDTRHMIACGFDPTEAYEKLKSHIRIIHLKDEDKPGHGVVMGKVVEICPTSSEPSVKTVLTA